MEISASIKSMFNHQETVISTNDVAKSMNIAVKSSGYGSSINGAELLLLSLATCFCNDIYREAELRNIPVSGVEVVFTGEFGAPGESGSNFRYKAHVTSDASDEMIRDLIRDTDRIAEIHTTLRNGISISLDF